MDTNTIREAVLARPFKPFTRRMNDGREFAIRHPEFVAVSRRTVFVIDARTNAGVILEPILISSVKPAELPSAAALGSGNRSDD